MNVGYDVVDGGDRVDGAGDGVVEALGRGPLVRASEVEFGPELVECDAGVAAWAQKPVGVSSARSAAAASSAYSSSVNRALTARVRPG